MQAARAGCSMEGVGTVISGGRGFCRVCLLLIFLVLLPVFPAYAASIVSPGSVAFVIGSTSYSVGNTAYAMDVAPFIRDNRVFVPVRYLADALGCSVAWDAGTGAITIVNGSTTIDLKVGGTTLLVNGIPQTMDVSPAIVNGRAMLPARWVAQALGDLVGWDPGTQTILISVVNAPTADSGVSSSPVQISGAETIPGLSYAPSVATDTRELSWEFDGRKYDWSVAVPEDLLSWDEQVNQLVNTFYGSDGYDQNQILAANPQNIDNLILANSVSADGNFTPWVTEATNSLYVDSLAKWLANQAVADGYDYFHTAEFAQSFVGGAMPYQVTSSPELPAETVFENGDCKDKSILLAGILNSMGYNVALLYFPPPVGQVTGHEAVGVQFTKTQLTPATQRSMDYYPYNGIKYYFAETTEPGWLIGQRSDQEPGYTGPSEATGYVYPVDRQQ